MVAKRKDSAALFEVISKARQSDSESGLDVPGWMDNKNDESAASLEPTARPKLKPLGGVSSQQKEGSAPVVSTTEGRLQLSLSYTGGTVIAVVLVLVIAAAFMLGRKTAQPSAPVTDSLDAALNTDLMGDAGNASASEAAGSSAGGVRQTGKWYLVIQELKGNSPQDQAEAWRIVDFCKQHGEYADVVEFPRRKKVAVWSLTGFDSGSSDGALEHAGLIENVGKLYFKKFRTYNFKQNDPENPWYLPHN